MVLYFVRQSVSPPADELLLASGAPYPRMWCDIPGSHIVHSSNLPGLESECPPDPLSTPSIPPSPPLPLSWVPEAASCCHLCHDSSTNLH